MFFDVNNEFFDVIVHSALSIVTKLNFPIVHQKTFNFSWLTTLAIEKATNDWPILFENIKKFVVKVWWS